MVRAHRLLEHLLALLADDQLQADEGRPRAGRHHSPALLPLMARRGARQMAASSPIAPTPGAESDAPDDDAPAGRGSLPGRLGDVAVDSRIGVE